jgi:N-acetylmuramoyl-L-alanine amidase
MAALALAVAVVAVVAADRLGRTRSGTAMPPTDHVPATATLDSPIHAGFPTLAVASPTAGAPATPVPPPPNRVGLIPGHWQFDSGAVCPDGRREVDVTSDVAVRVRAILEARGLEVDLLPEHDPDAPEPPLQGYRAAALVSIHADSCDVPGASGFKVARWPYSYTGTADDRLVACLYREYAAATLLPRHDESITVHMTNYYVHMTNYYAFREIAAETPAAIIELGFLGDDRAMLEDHRYEMALGVANAIRCFLDGEA